ncbi:MAG: cephalosporin hydroxylase family protein [Candidatus Devosia phytovorans]|uniref:Cephalosporin hydroxylase family protein n=1 Tax=Candidatus Devosia phytovorans TaxID=3121372 RepID=A0AAJ6AZG6_9HYPH|nr:cephalosporin hydroxylase family protein [Devosia sp.]WEK03786.1 MAG: cephalosporin hydroxylase family protein [Devosia sp.]
MDPQEQFRSERETRIRAMAGETKLRDLSRQWTQESVAQQYVYNFDWLGRPIIQYPQDMVAFQEIVWKTKPDLIIETGIAHGGSLVLSASLLAMLDYADAATQGTVLDPAKPKRKVLGIDIDIREHNRKAILEHPFAARIDMIQGSSIDPKTVAQVHDYARGANSVLVCLDSNHTEEHVLEELQAYAPLTSVGSYCIVFDTFVEDLAAGSFPNRPWEVGNNPKTAVWKYLETNKEFTIDKTIHDKLLTTAAPDGFLLRG